MRLREKHSKNDKMRGGFSRREVTVKCVSPTLNAWDLATMYIRPCVLILGREETWNTRTKALEAQEIN